MVKIGIMSFAHMHALSYANCVNQIKDAQLSGIADDDISRGRKMARQCKTKCFDSYRSLLDSDIDAVIVTSQNARHEQMVRQAARAGKHILCEKPIAATLPQARRIIDTCSRYGVKLQIAFPCRFLTSVIRAKEIIAEDKIGKILAVRGTNHGTMPGDWFVDKKESGGGAVIDHTVHVVDLMRWLLSSEVKSVYAEIDTLFYDMDIDDTGLLTMEFDNGVFASLDTSWSRLSKSFPTWGDVTMEIVGEKGVIGLDAFNQKVCLYNNKKVKSAWVCWADNMDLGLMEDFVKMLREDGQPGITGYDGLAALEVAVAAYRSARRKEVVALPLN